VPVGLLAGDPEFGTLGQTGGFKDHATHTHNVTSNATTTSATVQPGAGATVVARNERIGHNSTEIQALVHEDGRTAASAIPILQPYFVIYSLEAHCLINAPERERRDEREPCEEQRRSPTARTTARSRRTC
jgi:hypothetical protein